MCVKRLGGDLPQTTMHTVVEPGLPSFMWVFLLVYFLDF